MAPIRSPQSTNTHASATAPPSNPTLPPTMSHPSSAPAETDTAQEPPRTQTSLSKKRKRKERPHILHSCTFRKANWSYFHLVLLTPALTTPSNPSTSVSASADIDALTVSTLLTPPLQAFLGLTGSSIPIDILKTAGREVWLRVPRQDAKVLRAALTGWVGACDVEMVPGVESDGGDRWGKVRVAWRVLCEGQSLALLQGDGMDLFGG